MFETCDNSHNFLREKYTKYKLRIAGSINKGDSASGENRGYSFFLRGGHLAQGTFQFRNKGRSFCNL